MTHKGSDSRQAALLGFDPREAVLDQVRELRDLLQLQPKAVRRNLSKCIVNAEQSLLEGSPDAAAHFRRLKDAADFVCTLRAQHPDSESLSKRTASLQQGLVRPHLVRHTG